MQKVTLFGKRVRGKLSSTYYLRFPGRDIRSTGITDPELAEQLRARRKPSWSCRRTACLSPATTSGHWNRT